MSDLEFSLVFKAMLSNILKMNTLQPSYVPLDRVLSSYLLMKSGTGKTARRQCKLQRIVRTDA